MTIFENLARLFPLHIQRIAELTDVKEVLTLPSKSRVYDLGGLFLWHATSEGPYYWSALANGRGLEYA